MKSAHVHPHPRLDSFTQYGALALCLVIFVAAVAQILAIVVGAPGAFVLTALLTLAFVPYILLLTTATPAITVTPEGLTIQPRIWRQQFVAWDAVLAIKDYPLLPTPDSEVMRKALSGRKSYSPAQGKMLVIAGLPLEYRLTGWFAGEGFTPVIAITNRTHTDYENLLHQIERSIALGTPP